MRNTNRKNNQLRNIELICDYNPYAEGSCLVKFGNTHVVCTASVEEKVPKLAERPEQGLDHRRIRHASARQPGAGAARVQVPLRPHAGNPAADRTFAPGGG